MNEDLKDTTFIVAVRLDSIARLENLILTVDCIQKSFNTNIIILEAAPYKNGLIPSLLKDIIYLFEEDNDPVFHRTKYLNKMAKMVQTDIISLWDTDIILESKQILSSIQQLRSGDYDVAFPYNGDFYDTSDILRKHYWKHRDIEFLKQHRNKMDLLYSSDEFIGAVGGAVFIKTMQYLNSGMDNEKFYGWGCEDGERYYRWIEFNYKIYRSEGCLFHLSHPRDLNGMFRSSNHCHKAKHVLNEIVNYSKEELNNEFLKKT